MVAVIAANISPNSKIFLFTTAKKLKCKEVEWG